MVTINDTFSLHDNELGMPSKKNNPFEGTLSQLGGEGVNTPLKYPYLKYHSTRELFSMGGGSQIIISFVLFLRIGLKA